MHILASEIHSITQQPETMENNIGVQIMETVFNVLAQLLNSDFDEALDQISMLLETLLSPEEQASEQPSESEINRSESLILKDTRMNEIKRKIAETNNKISHHINGNSSLCNSMLMESEDEMVNRIEMGGHSE